MWYRFGVFETGELTPDIVADVITEAQELRAACRHVPVLHLIELLHEAGRLFVQEGHPLREEALARLPGIVNFSLEMTRAGLEALADNLSRTAMLRRLTADLGDLYYVDEFRFLQPFEGQVKAEPRGVVAHVAAGNVFVSAVDSLAQGIVTKNVNLLKMSGADPLFPFLFARAVQEVDPHGIVSRTFALLPFRGGNVEVENQLKTRCNAIVVYGGGDAVAAYRSGCGLHTHLIEYGPKYSCALLDAAALERAGLDNVCELVGRDLTMWDQSACTSPHTIYVNDRDTALRFAEKLAAHMAGWAERLPHGAIPLQEQVEITRTRELARVGQALGEGQLFIPAKTRQDWTIVYEEEPTFRVSCHHRTGYVKPLTGIGQLAEILKPYGEFVQSVGILADPATTYAWADQLIAVGADRITEVGDMTRRKHGAPHDGGRGTAELVRWIGLGRAERFQDHFDYQDDAVRDRTTLCRLNILLDICRESAPFYQDRLPQGDLRSLDDLQKIPVLSQADFRAHLPPSGSGIVARELGSSISYGSGGTTGTPKCVFRTNAETARNARALGKGYYLSAFGPGDVVANLLFAGNLWASFLSMNQALEHTGCHILPIGGHIPLEAMIYSQFGAGYEQVLWITNPSNIQLILALMGRAGVEPKPGQISFPVVGEYFTEAFREWVAEKFGHPPDAPFVVWTGYGSADTGDLGVETEETIRQRQHFHRNPAECLEAFGTDSAPMLLKPSERALLEVVEGNLVCTKDQLIPLVRYDTGDAGGLRDGVLFVLGRASDTLIFYGTNLRMAELSDHLLGLPEYAGYFQVSLRAKEGVEILSFVVSTPDDADRASLFQRSLVDFLKSRSREFAVKYDALSASAGEPLIQVRTERLTAEQGKLKHRYLVEAQCSPT